MTEETKASSTSIRAADGTHIAYSLTPGGAGKPRIALIHSLSMDRHFWAPVAQALAGDASVLAIDCRGHGQSDKPAQSFTTALFASDLSDVFDAINWPTAVVAGASMGGCVSLQFAADYPDRVDGLGLIDTTAWYGETAPEDWEARASRALAGGLEPLIEFQTTRWFSDSFRSARPDVVKSCVDTFLRNDVHAFAATCRMLGAFDGRDALSDVRVPAAIIVGDEDYAAPVAMAQALKDGIRDPTMKVIPGARHLTPLEVPAVVAAEMRQLIERSRQKPLRPIEFNGHPKPSTDNF